MIVTNDGPYSTGPVVIRQLSVSAYMDARTTLALDLINTDDPYFAQPESLREPADLARFLAERGMPAARPPDEGDLVAARAVRDRLRAVFAAADAGTAAAALNDLLAEIRVQPRVVPGADGAWEVAMSVGGDVPLVKRLAAEAALGLGMALSRHGFDRLRVCASDPCREAFIDTSRNASRRFCSDRCANRSNVAAFRRRQRAT